MIVKKSVISKEVKSINEEETRKKRGNSTPVQRREVSQLCGIM